MHVIGIRRSLADENPWLPVNVYQAFLEAKDVCYKDMEKIGHLFTTLPWPVYELERVRALMGEDFWPYGINENAAELDAIFRYAYEQGLTVRKLTQQELFAKSTFELPKL